MSNAKHTDSTKLSSHTNVQNKLKILCLNTIKMKHTNYETITAGIYSMRSDRISGGKQSGVNQCGSK